MCLGRGERMHWIRSIALLLVALYIPVPLWPQEQTEKSKLVSDLSAKVSGAIDESRDRAHHELFADYVHYQAPDIAGPLADPHSFIGFVSVTHVKYPGEGNPYSTRVTLHVDQLLRGPSEQTELQAESRWVPPRPSGDEVPIIDSGPRGTIFDYKKPDVGNRFLIGFPALDVDSGRAYIFGAIDLSNHDQASLTPEVERFLGIESAAGSSNFGPFLTALNDSVPWIRDLSAQRLIQSETCNNSSACREALLNSARRLLRSKKPGERWEALQWMQPLTLPTGERQAGPNGLPPMSKSAVRELLVLALSDPNLWIADEAFCRLELFDFFQSAGPGECIVVFPPLRKSVRLPFGELKGVSMSGANACTPGQDSSDGE